MIDSECNVSKKYGKCVSRFGEEIGSELRHIRESNIKFDKRELKVFLQL